MYIVYSQYAMKESQTDVIKEIEIFTKSRVLFGYVLYVTSKSGTRVRNVPKSHCSCL